MSKNIIFWGASGHAKVLQEFICHLGYTLIAIFDNNPEIQSPFSEIPLYYGIEGFLRWKENLKENKKIASLVAIGGTKGYLRLEIQRFLESHHIITTTVIHPTAFVAANVTISAGSQLLAKSAVCSDVTIGEACIINTSSSVDHETILGKGVHIAPGVTICGCVRIGDFSFIGSGAVILPRIKIGTNVIVGAGSVVTHDVPNNKVVYGNPAKIIRNNLEYERS